MCPAECRCPHLEPVCCERAEGCCCQPSAPADRGPSGTPAPTCDYCGSLAWTVEKYGRVEHKQDCPHRTDPWHQGQPVAVPGPASARCKHGYAVGDDPSVEACIAGEAPWSDPSGSASVSPADTPAAAAAPDHAPVRLTPHKFAGRTGRLCEVCNRPDRDSIHALPFDAILHLVEVAQDFLSAEYPTGTDHLADAEANRLECAVIEAAKSLPALLAAGERDKAEIERMRGELKTADFFRDRLAERLSLIETAVVELEGALACDESVDPDHWRNHVRGAMESALRLCKRATKMRKKREATG